MVKLYKFLKKRSASVSPPMLCSPEFYIHGLEVKQPLTYFSLVAFLTTLQNSAEADKAVLQTWYLSTDLTRFFDPPRLDKMSPQECVHLFELVSQFQTSLESQSSTTLDKDITQIAPTDMVENIATLILDTLASQSEDQVNEFSLSLYPHLDRIRTSFTSKTPKEGQKLIGFIENRHKAELERVRTSKTDLEISQRERALRQRRFTIEKLTTLMGQIRVANQPIDSERTFFANCQKLSKDLLENPHENDDEALFQLEQDVTAYLRGIPTYYPEIGAWAMKPSVMRIFVFPLDRDQRNSPLVLHGMRPRQNDHDLRTYDEALAKIRGRVKKQFPESGPQKGVFSDEGIADCGDTSQKPLKGKETKSPVKPSKKQVEGLPITQAMPPTTAISLVKPGESNTDTLTFKIPTCNELEVIDPKSRVDIERDTQGFATRLNTRFKTVLGVTVEFENYQEVKDGKKKLSAPTQAHFSLSGERLREIYDLDQVLKAIDLCENEEGLNQVLDQCQKLIKFKESHVMSQTPFGLTAWFEFMKVFGETPSKAERGKPRTVTYKLLTTIEFRLGKLKADSEKKELEKIEASSKERKKLEQEQQAESARRDKEKDALAKIEKQAKRDAELVKQKEEQRIRLIKFVIFISLLVVIPAAIAVYYLATQPTLPPTPPDKDKKMNAGGYKPNHDVVKVKAGSWEYQGTYDLRGIDENQPLLGFLQGTASSKQSGGVEGKFNLAKPETQPHSLLRTGTISLIRPSGETYYNGEFDLSRASSSGHFEVSFTKGTIILIKDGLTVQSTGEFEIRGDSNFQFQLLRGDLKVSNNHKEKVDLSVPLSRSGNPNFNRRVGTINVEEPGGFTVASSGTFDVTRATNTHSYVRNLLEGTITFKGTEGSHVYTGRFDIPATDTSTTMDELIERNMRGTKQIFAPDGSLTESVRIG